MTGFTLLNPAGSVDESRPARSVSNPAAAETVFHHRRWHGVDE
jgi:hypothetical protein